MLHAMIMAGGGGTRFWPRSRQRRPKQFLTMAGDRTLLQQARDRIESAVPAERTWVITGQAYREETAAQLPELPADHVIEPVQEFRRAVHVAAQAAAEHPQALVTFGIVPPFPDTGYGYIR